MRNLLIVLTTSLLLAACQERSQQQTTESDPTLIAQYSIGDYLMRSLGANSGYEVSVSVRWIPPGNHLIWTLPITIWNVWNIIWGRQSALFRSHEKSEP